MVLDHRIVDNIEYGKIVNSCNDADLKLFEDIQITSKEMGEFPYYIFFKSIMNNRLGVVQLNDSKQGIVKFQDANGIEFDIAVEWDYQ